MKNNKKSEKPPFEVRWETFRKAYFEWARCNPYKENPYPKYDEYWKKEFNHEEAPKDFVKRVSYYDEVDRLAKHKYREDIRKRKVRIKSTKIRLRRELKWAFLDLF